MEQNAILDGGPGAVEIVTEVRREAVLLKAGALQNAIFNSANFSSIATGVDGRHRERQPGAGAQTIKARPKRCSKKQSRGHKDVWRRCEPT